MYYVLGDGGSKYGPADLDTLKQWAAENRILPTMMLEDANTGAQMMASSVPGLWPGAAPAAPAPPSSPAPDLGQTTTYSGTSSVSSPAGSTSSYSPSDPASTSSTSSSSSSYSSPASPTQPGSPYSSSSPSSGSYTPPGGAQPGSPYGSSQSPYSSNPYGSGGSTYQAPPADEGKGFMIGSWITGALGLVCTCIPFISPLLALVGVILGFVGKSKGNSVALFAAIFSIVSLLISGGYTIYFISIMGSPEFQNAFQQGMREGMQQQNSGGSPTAPPAPEGTGSL